MVEENRLTEIIGQGEFDMFEWGWVVEPDPDYQLSTFTCGSRSYKSGGEVLANLSDSFYRSPPTTSSTSSRRSPSTRPSGPRSSSRCRRCCMTTRRTWLTFYYDDPQAYRSDRFAGFLPQPDPGGVLLFQMYSSYSYRSIAPPQASPPPATAAAKCPLIEIERTRVAVLGGAGVLFALRRRSTQDERE